MGRKVDSTLEPVTLTVTLPTEVPLTAEMVEVVRLILSPKLAVESPAVVDAIIPSNQWAVSGQDLTLTWKPTPGQLPSARYVGEVWITDTAGETLKAPSDGYVDIPVHASLVPAT
jgi:hypothetical protein